MNKSMIEIEKIFPYTIVSNDDSKYGIVDNRVISLFLLKWTT